MLDKSPCRTDVSILIAILTIEADLNSLHKIMFNQRILPALEKHNLILMDIVGGSKSETTIHTVINKKLIVDISNKNKDPSAVISADATKYYDKVAHPFTSLTVQHFGVHIDFILVLLSNL